MRLTASPASWQRSFVVLIAFCLLLLPHAVHAKDDIAIILDGQQLVLSDAAPEIVDSRTFVPLRLISESMGIDVSYEESSRTVTVGEGIFRHVVGDSFVTMQDGSIVDIAVPSYIKAGRTMVSLRLFAETLACQVAWDGEARSVTLITAEGKDLEPTVPSLQTITNGRFNFSLDIPTSWIAEDRSDNGDGFFIVCDEAAVDIRVFGSFEPGVFGYEETLAELLDAGAEEFEFADGSVGYLKKEATVYEYILLSDTVKRSFFVDFTAAPDWFEANQELLERIAMSLRISY